MCTSIINLLFSQSYLPSWYQESGFPDFFPLPLPLRRRPPRALGRIAPPFPEPSRPLLCFAPLLLEPPRAFLCFAPLLPSRHAPLCPRRRSPGRRAPTSASHRRSPSRRTPLCPRRCSPSRRARLCSTPPLPACVPHPLPRIHGRDTYSLCSSRRGGGASPAHRGGRQGAGSPRRRARPSRCRRTPEGARRLPHPRQGRRG
jgi:hypothetical protein